MPSVSSHSSSDVWVVRAGLVPYDDARAAQKRLEAARVADQVPDVLLLLEHPPVYTRGRRSTPDELPMGEDAYRMRGIEVCDTDRGGRVTYHGPGQLVGYPLVALRGLGRGSEAPEGEDPGRLDVVGYVRLLERLIIDALCAWGVEAGVVDGLTGVWTPERRKIGSIGVHVSRGVTTHGFAINVNNDLEPFEWIVPCGIESCQMTSVARELDGEVELGAFATTVRDRFGELYGRSPVEVGSGELADRVPGVGALAGSAPALR
jgi:lipoyl(octanoyl) transferase